MPYVHFYDHRQPATEIQTVHSARTDRTQYTHRSWLSSYLLSFLIPELGSSMSRDPYSEKTIHIMSHADD